MRLRWLTGVTLSLCPLVYGYEGGYNDAEIHFVDFFQRTDGIKYLVHKMDQSHIEYAFIMGLPVVKKWSSYDPVAPKYDFGDDSPMYYYSL